MSDTRYVVGIDLGTTHSVVAYAPTATGETPNLSLQILPIPQVVAPGEVKPRPLLPSFLFLPGPHDVPPEGLRLPWNGDGSLAVGEYARERGSEIPQRLVASAKSWLCHGGVDRTAPILPWEAPGDARKVSPVEASALFLSHLRDAWNHVVARDEPEARLEHQDILLTVPASFDAVARELTVEAARQAGLQHLTLLEEPQASVYAWLAAVGDAWRDRLQVGDLVLVCDVGGGTSDFSLVQVVEEDGALALRRMAVGEHILLGGDNMDLALAHAVRAKLASQGTRLDGWQFRSLWFQCRKAKEKLLNRPSLESVPLSVLGRGSALIGGTVKTELTRDELESVLLEGFFPACGADAVPEVKPRVGVREMGLPYEADPGVTRHLAAFLARHLGPVGSSGPAPTHVLFNGGVMKPELVRRRLLDVLASWYPERPPVELPSQDPDLAVAKGAAAYGLVRRGRGIRIRAGAARSYYIGIESAMPAVPGIPTPVKALCVVPFGLEEGSTVQIRERTFGLVVGEPAVFPLMASTTRKDDPAGEVVEDWAGEIQEVNAMETVLEGADPEEGGSVLPVWLEARFTEVGVLELWCVSAQDETRRWKLAFSLRENETS
ncbi:Molecular chaperone DnaK (HSP70) [Desulfacinum hydrothermale DSM 13146]|uniref:Molecular chaperone DnaK (HSP70) n=1 Tax=Desulfacinum hydrothermale DSM 13146 TaxID=1121390 RepID=A0A1W1XUI0_9BACT|nr:Hsp70 family protein [Desulfacinum hydrothermale]SMC27494.1 Molecular chaperone DnaK (HSP70) [Desulfacinum hydrothermale DSM 13146]